MIGHLVKRSPKRSAIQPANELSPRQRWFLDAYIETGRITKAAEAAGVSRVCHHKWLQKTNYAAAFAEAKRRRRPEVTARGASRRARLALGLRHNPVGPCSICGDVERLVADHCHKTQEPRGALCRKCNVGIGMFRDDPAIAQRAAEYLHRQGRGIEATLASRSTVTVLDESAKRAVENFLAWREQRGDSERLARIEDEDKKAAERAESKRRAKTARSRRSTPLGFEPVLSGIVGLSCWKAPTA